jgi:hypothetical protein
MKKLRKRQIIIKITKLPSNLKASKQNSNKIVVIIDFSALD